MGIKIACLVPHPPIIVPEIGGKRANEAIVTIKAMEKLSLEVKDSTPKTLIFISPHSPAFSDAFAVKTRLNLDGSFAQFGASHVSFDELNDVELANRIIAESSELNVPDFDFGEQLVEMGYSDQLDHGILVPLYYLRNAWEGSIVSISISDLSFFKHYLFGLAIQRSVDALDRNIALIASGDLSHRLTPDAPAGYSKRGKDFDYTIKEIMERGDFEKLFDIDKSLLSEAGECGFRSILMMAGMLNGYDVETEVLSYEGPFGVGYMVAYAKPVKRDNERELIDKVSKTIKARKEKSVSEESEPVKLAREAVEAYVRNGGAISVADDVPDFMKKKRGAVFVSLKKNSALRGCIGTTAPTQPSIAQEIIKNAISAATRDPRFPPVQSDEIADLVYSVDILDEPEKIPDQSHLDPKTYGVIVESGFRKGLLLPDIDGVDSVEDQITIAKQKAGIAPGEKVSLYRFKVTRYR